MLKDLGLDLDLTRSKKPFKVQLALPSKVITQNILNINTANISDVKLNSLPHFEFEIPYLVESKNKSVTDEIEYIKNPDLDNIKEEKLIKLTWYGGRINWFRIMTIEKNDSSDGISTKISCDSLESELRKTNVTIDGTGIGVEEYFNKTLEQSPWKLGYVSDKLKNTYRTFSEQDKQTRYEAIQSGIESYGAITDFDGETRTLNLLTIDELRVFRGVVLKRENYASSIDITSTSEEIVTRMYGKGNEDLDISSANPTGMRYIEDFSYFIYPFKRDANKNVLEHSAYMSDELAHALLDLIELEKTYNPKINDLQKLINQAYVDLTKKMTEKADLDGEMLTLQALLDTAKSTNNKPLITQRQTEIVAKQKQIDDKVSEINSINASIELWNNTILGYQETISTNSFQPKLVEELKLFVYEKDFSDDRYIDAKELYDATVKEFEKYQKPTRSFKTDLASFINSIESKKYHGRLEIGEEVKIKSKKLGEEYTSIILGYSGDLVSGDFQLEISDNMDDIDALDRLATIIYQAESSSSILSNNKYKWNNIVKVKDEVTAWRDKEINTVNNRIVAGANESITMDNRGMMVRNPDFPNEVIIIQSGVVALSKDNGKTWNTSITPNGVIADTLIGKILAGNNLIITNASGSFVIDNTGMTVNMNSIRIMSGDAGNPQNVIESWNKLLLTYNEIASDSLVNEYEKNQLKIQWNKIADIHSSMITAFLKGWSQQPVIEPDPNNPSPNPEQNYPDEYGVYIQAYEDLNTYLNTTKQSDGYTLLDEANKTKTTTIDSQVFKKKFLDYDKAKQALESIISFTYTHSQIKVLETGISLEYVKNDNVVTALNLSEEGVKIDGKLLEINSKTEFNADLVMNAGVIKGKDDGIIINLNTGEIKLNKQVTIGANSNLVTNEDIAPLKGTIVSTLSNDLATIFTDANGSSGNYDYALTEMNIYKDGVLDNNNWAFSTERNDNVVYTITKNSVKVLSIKTNSETLVIVATQGKDTIKKEFKIKKYTDTTGNINRWMITPDVIHKTTHDEWVGTPLVIMGNEQLVGKDTKPYSGRYKVYESKDGGLNYSVKYTSSADESMISYSPREIGVTHVKLQFYLAGSTLNLIDEQVLSVIIDKNKLYPHTAYANSSDGTDGFTPDYKSAVGLDTLNVINWTKNVPMTNSTYNFTRNDDNSFKVTGIGTSGYEVLSKSFPAKVGDKFRFTVRYTNRIVFGLYNNYGLQFVVNDTYTDSVILTSKIVLPKEITMPTEYQLEYTATTDNVWMQLNFGGVLDSSQVNFDVKIEVENLTNPVKYAYMGTYTDTNIADSTNYADYTWIRIKGNDGKDGVAGKDGVGINSTVITYTTSTSGTVTPTTGWTSQVPTLVKGQYLWTKTVWNYSDGTSESGYTVSYIAKDGNTGNDGIAGKDGVGITSTTITYAQSTSGTTAPSSGWTSSVPSVPAGQFLWTKTVWRYSDSTSETGYSVAMMGTKGDKGDTGNDGVAGKDGVGIKTTVITYAISTSGTTAPTTGWTSSVPSLVKGQYLWTKTVWTYTDNSSETGYSVTYISKDGNNGNDGIAGKDGTGIKTTTITYAGSTSGTVAPTSNWTNSVPSVLAGQFLWTKTVWTYTDNTSETGYSVAMMGAKGDKGDKGDQGIKGLQGLTGTQGVPGAKGADGKTQYTHIAYANSADGTANFSTSDSNRTYIGMYVDFNVNDSNIPSDYSWTLVKGADGTQGTPGKPGADGKTPYFHTAWSYNANGSDRFTTIYPMLNMSSATKSLGAPWFIFPNSVISKGTGLYGSTEVNLTVNQTNDNYTNVFNRGFDLSFFKPSTTYTFSFYCKGSGTVNSYVYPSLIDTNKDFIVDGTKLTTPADGNAKFTINGSYTVHTITLTTKATISDISSWLFRCYGNVNITICLPKVEEGSTATPWMPSQQESTTADYPSFIGQYTDFTQADSTNPSSYTWSLIRGIDGESALATILTNDNVTFVGNETSALPATATTQIISYLGSNQKESSIGTITGLPTGMTANITNNNSITPSVTFTVTNSMTSKSGVVSIPITVGGQTINKLFSYSLSLKGSSGSDAIAVTMSSNSSIIVGDDKNALATTLSTDISSLKGTTNIPVVVGTITGLPTGMTASVVNNNSNKATINFTITTSLVSKSGTIIIPVTAGGIVFNKSYSYALALKGVDGRNSYSHTAYSWSADGKDGFTTVYPNLNLLNGSRTYSKSNPYVLTGKDIDTYTKLTDVTANLKAGTYTLSAKTDGVWVNHGTTTDPNVNGVCLWLVSSENNVNISLGNKVPQTINVPKDGIYCIRVNTYSDGTTNVSRKFWDFKLDSGSTATPWMPSESEVKTSDYPNYIGIYSDNNVESSLDYKKYQWAIFKGQNSNAYTAYSWSSDGTDRFTTTYPNLNLLQGTNAQAPINSSWKVTDSTQISLATDENAFIASLTPTTNVQVGFFQEGVSANIGATYTVSAFVKNMSSYTFQDFRLTLIKRGDTTYVYPKSFTIPNDNQYHYISFSYQLTATDAKSVGAQFLVNNAPSNVQTLFRTKYPKLELGTTATPWTPSESEAQDQWQDAIPRYVGLGEKDSQNSSDYRWQLNPRYVQASSDNGLSNKAEVDDLASVADTANDALVQAQNAVSNEDYTSWLEHGYKSTIKNLQDVSAQNKNDIKNVNNRTTVVEGFYSEMKVKWNFIDESFSFSEEGMFISNAQSKMSIQITSDKIVFWDNNVDVAFITGEVLNIQKGVFLESATIGNHLITKFSDSSPVTIIRYVGGNT